MLKSLIFPLNYMFIYFYYVIKKRFGFVKKRLAIDKPKVKQKNSEKKNFEN